MGSVYMVRCNLIILTNLMRTNFYYTIRKYPNLLRDFKTKRHDEGKYTLYLITKVHVKGPCYSCKQHMTLLPFFSNLSAFFTVLTPFDPSKKRRLLTLFLWNFNPTEYTNDKSTSSHVSATLGGMRCNFVWVDPAEFRDRCRQIKVANSSVALVSLHGSI